MLFLGQSTCRMSTATQARLLISSSPYRLIALSSYRLYSSSPYHRTGARARAAIQRAIEVSSPLFTLPSPLSHLISSRLISSHLVSYRIVSYRLPHSGVQCLVVAWHWCGPVVRVYTVDKPIDTAIDTAIDAREHPRHRLTRTAIGKVCKDEGHRMCLETALSHYKGRTVTKNKYMKK